MVDKKTFAIGFVIYFVILTVYLYNNSNNVATSIINDGIKGVLWYFLTNPAYLLLLFSVFIFNSGIDPWRNVLGSLMIILAADIISFPRFLTPDITKEMALLASSDGIFFRAMVKQGFTYDTSFMIYYLILPIILIIGALAILGIHNLFKILAKKGA